MMLQAPPEPTPAQLDMAPEIPLPTDLRWQDIRSLMSLIEQHLRTESHQLRRCGRARYKETGRDRGATTRRLWCRFTVDSTLDYEVRPADGKKFHDGQTCRSIIVIPVGHGLCDCAADEVSEDTRDEITMAMAAIAATLEELVRNQYCAQRTA